MTSQSSLSAPGPNPAPALEPLWSNLGTNEPAKALARAICSANIFELSPPPFSNLERPAQVDGVGHLRQQALGPGNARDSGHTPRARRALHLQVSRFGFEFSVFMFRVSGVFSWGMGFWS